MSSPHPPLPFFLFFLLSFHLTISSPLFSFSPPLSPTHLPNSSSPKANPAPTTYQIYHPPCNSFKQPTFLPQAPTVKSVMILCAKFVIDSIGNVEFVSHTMGSALGGSESPDEESGDGLCQVPELLMGRWPVGAAVGTVSPPQSPTHLKPAPAPPRTGLRTS